MSRVVPQCHLDDPVLHAHVVDQHVALAAVLAWQRMDNLTCMRNDSRALRDASHDRHTWILSFLYVGTFGSFIGFSFAFGQALLIQSPAELPTPLDAAYLTFLGPLLGSLIRPVGGMLAERFGGAQVTLWNFAAMTGGTAVVLAASYAKSLPLLVAGFTVLFVLSGAGNGST
jgi:NNP family nitrate/nitrite transporter-like MFS transporter